VNQRKLIKKARMYYLRDDRQVVGNCLLWWRKGRAGYTCNLDDAHVFTKEEAFAQHECRETDRPYPVDYINSIAYRHVDHQVVDREEWKDAPEELEEAQKQQPTNQGVSFEEQNDSH